MHAAGGEGESFQNLELARTTLILKNLKCNLYSGIISNENDALQSLLKEIPKSIFLHQFHN